MSAERRFRDVMAQVPAPVAVLTTQSVGTPHGTTVSAFISVSLEPPTLLVSLDNTSTLLSTLELGAAARLNVLTTHQADIAAHFARKNTDDIAVPWELTDSEPPRLPGCLAWLTFIVTDLLAVSDHTLVIGTVTTAHAGSGAPLIHWQRTYARAATA